MRRFLCILAATIPLACVASAAARTRHHRAHRHRAPAEWHGTRAQALAIAEQRAYDLWGIKPCAGAWKVEFVPEQRLYEATGIPETANIILIEGASGWESPTGPDVYTSPPSTWTGCLTELDVARWPEVAPAPLNWYTDWTAICSSVLHEAGLLTGHGELTQTTISEPVYEPPGMTPEQLAVMHQSGVYDQHRCGYEP